MTDSRREHQDVRIGTLVPPSRPADYLQQILPHGFESFELVFDPAMAADLDLGSLAESIRQVLDRSPAPATISCLGIYGNPLTSAEVEQNWHRLVAACPDFGCDLVCGFTGRLVDRPVPESIPRFAEVFGRLADRAGEQGVRLAFENCDMGGDWDRGDWNIAHAPAAWELMFDAVDVPNLGLEWEPCHQMVSLVDPLGQLHEWAERVFHVHGKDATILWDVIRRRGLRGGEGYVHHRTPGFGDTDWTDVISTLRLGGFRGSIDIEGWHDPVYRDDLEMTGQVRALAYLKQCRGGPFVPNPQMDDDGR